jgi:histidinol phosphatase-like PHP family hydrolase
VPWGLGATVVLDSHTHTRFSDGASTPIDVVRAAAINGCGAVAIIRRAQHILT